MRELIEKIEAAKEGGRELDEAIALATGWKVRIGKGGFVYIYSPDKTRVNPTLEMGPRFDPHTGKKLWDEDTIVKEWADECDLPCYTTSLDAALPGEKIVHVKAPGWNSAKPAGRWQVACETDEPGHAVYAHAHTEVLARRAACLRAIDAADATRKSARR